MKTINDFLNEGRSFEKKDSAKAIIRDSEGKILILRITNNQGGQGNWDLPGGTIEKGENRNDTLKREVFEETNLKVDNIKYLTSFVFKIPERGVNREWYIYTCKTEGTDVKLKPATWKGSKGAPEHNQYMWIGKKVDLENLPMLPKLKEILMKELK